MPVTSQVAEKEARDAELPAAIQSLSAPELNVGGTPT